jgi:hypothetical protein
MRLKGHDACRQAPKVAGEVPHGGEERLMAQVEAVEVADRDDGARKGGIDGGDDGDADP